MSPFGRDPPAVLDPDLYRQASRHDLLLFTERVFRELRPEIPFLPSPHLELVASKLEDCREGRTLRQILNLPPRHLKSLMASVAFPAFLLGHDPSLSIICASYGQELAEAHARDCRAVMMTAWYQDIFPRTRLARQATHDLGTTARGSRLATSVGGPLTGRGADVIIIDDPLKPDEALSETRRTAVNDWFDNTLLSRLNSQNTGVIIIVMQRLHTDDLVGHVLGSA